MNDQDPKMCKCKCCGTKSKYIIFLLVVLITLQTGYIYSIHKQVAQHQKALFAIKNSW